MSKRCRTGIVILILGVANGAGIADDVRGTARLLCASAQATVCTAEEGCEIGPPWMWNIPAFIEVDLDRNLLRTTEASGENRSTPVRSVEREGGRIYLQGIENERAFSLAIDERTGRLTAAVARDGFTVSVFGACTQLPE